mmetsp:Transcript_4211/g.12073  ORF Transcript_4211/g.12073 Transcript_4211/m.12073 type:complete len:204 (+) Transcript_4211:3027-3638(+)
MVVVAVVVVVVAVVVAVVVGEDEPFTIRGTKSSEDSPSATKRKLPWSVASVSSVLVPGRYSKGCSRKDDDFVLVVVFEMLSAGADFVAAAAVAGAAAGGGLWDFSAAIKDAVPGFPEGPPPPCDCCRILSAAMRDALGGFDLFPLAVSSEAGLVFFWSSARNPAFILVVFGIKILSVASEGIDVCLSVGDEDGSGDKNSKEQR